MEKHGYAWTVTCRSWSVDVTYGINGHKSNKGSKSQQQSLNII